MLKMGSRTTGLKILMEAEGFFKDGKDESGAKLEVEPLWVD